MVSVCCFVFWLAQLSKNSFPLSQLWEGNKVERIIFGLSVKLRISDDDNMKDDDINHDNMRDNDINDDNVKDDDINDDNVKDANINDDENKKLFWERSQRSAVWRRRRPRHCP